MPRKPPPLAVYANPWHAPLDHNHRANCAVPWDPAHRAADRGFVGAVHRLDADGELYFEFEQYEHTHANANSALAAQRASLDAELTKAKATVDATHAGAKADAVHFEKLEERAQHLAEAQATRDNAIAAAVTAHAEAKAAVPDAPEEMDSLVLREGHAPVLLPDLRPKSDYYLRALRDGSLWAADEATHITAFGNADHFVPIEERAALAPVHRVQGHVAMYGELPDPKPRPAVGAGHIGESHAPRALAAVNPIAGAFLADAQRKGALPSALKDAARAALKRALDESAKTAAKAANGGTSLNGVG